MSTTGTQHRNETTIAADPALPTIEITREVDAPPDRVFRAYLHREPDGTEHGFHGVFHEALVESLEARDMMIASGMETGVVEGYERLDDLLAAAGAGA